MLAARSSMFLLALSLIGLGCATGGDPNLRDPDPWEPMNRGIFAFNETIDEYALEPVAIAFDFVLPEFAQTGLANFFDHLKIPTIFVNDLLQGKPGAAANDILRLLYNTIFGLGGFIDIATMTDIPKSDEDFGQTLGVWGVPSGPYLMMPLFGPYTLRSGLGRVVEIGATSYAYFTPFWSQVANLNGVETFGASAGLFTLELVSLRATYLEEIEAGRADAFDYYVFVRNAYLQNRRAKVLDQTDAPADGGEELYFFDDDEPGDDEEDFDDY